MIVTRISIIAFLICSIISDANSQDLTSSDAGANDPDVNRRRSLLTSAEHPPISIGQLVSNIEFFREGVKDDHFDLHQINGKVIILYFFSSRCGRCPEASRKIGSIYLTTPRSDLMAIGIMSSYYPLSEAFEVTARSRIPFPVIWDKEGQTFNSYGVNGVPIFAIIDSAGKLVKYCYIDRLQACVFVELNKLRQARKEK